MSNHDDFKFEPVPGLPEHLPEGEELLWQGRPGTLLLARSAFGLDWLAGYFVLIVIWRAAAGFSDGGATLALAKALPYVGLGLLGCGVVLLLAWASARATVYSITSARVVMRIGAALSITLNLPFSQIASADLARGPGDSGTIALRPLDNTKLSYIICWPHVRPWHMRHPEPALRCISNATDVAALLSKAAQMNLITARNQSARSSHAAQANTVAAE